MIKPSRATSILAEAFNIKGQGILVSEDGINGGDPLGPVNPFLMMPGTLHPFVPIYTSDTKSELKPPIKKNR